tara:strand:+ start:4598 stop:8422 length:3825 start_codon:yes stop_codon:yes gene_type:complete
MAKISSRDLFTQEDIFKGVRDSADKTLKKLTKFKGELKKLASQSQKAFKSVKIGDAKSIKTLMTLVEKANKINKESIAIDKARKASLDQKTAAEIQLIQIEKQKQQLTQEQLKTSRLKAQQDKRLNAEKKKTIKLAQQESSAYQKLVVNTRQLKTQSKELGAEMLKLEQSGKKNTQAYRKLEKQYRSVTSAAQQGDVQLKKLDKTVGDNFRNVGNYRGALGKLSAGLAQLGLAFGTAMIARNIGGIIVDFDQAQADLGAISGQTKDQLKGLTEQARELGKTTQFSATQITEMQIELAKLGFTNEQIKNSTKAVSNFAAATGADIPAAAKVAGSALRGFGLDVSEMERVVSVLGVATTKSGLSFQSFETGLSTIAPVAKQFGFSIEDTTTLLAKLADAGFDASSAATATRKILLNLADSGGDLAQELGRPITNVEDLGEAFKELKDRNIDLNEALELTDVKSVSAFGTFIDASDTLGDFKESITDVNAELQAMADKRLESISGQMKLLSSAWSEFILNTAESIGTSEKFKAVLGFLTENLETIMSVLGKLIRTWIVYKTTMIALRTIQRLQITNFRTLGSQMAKQIPLTKAYAREQKNLAKAKKGTTKATSGLASGLATMGIALAIGLVTELAVRMYDLASGEAEARRQADLLSQATVKGNKIAKATTGAFAEKLDEQLRTLDHATRTAIAEEKIEKKRAEIRENAIKQMDALTQATKKNIQTEIDAVIKRNKLREKNRDATHARGKAKESWVSKQLGSVAVSEMDDIFNKQIRAQNILTRALQKQRDELSKQSEEFKVRLIEETESNKDYGISITDNSNALGKSAKTYEEINKVFKQTNEHLSRQKKLLFDIQQIQDQRKIAEVQRDFDTEFNKQIENIQKSGTFEVEELHRILDEKFELEKQYIIDKRNFDLQAVDKNIALKEQKEIDALDDERKKLIKNAEGNATAIAQIEKNFITANTDLITEQIKRRKDAETEKIKIVEGAESDILDKKIEKETEYKDMHEELYTEVDTFDDDQRAKELENIRQNEETKRAIYKATTDFFLKQSQKRMKEIEEELALAKKQESFLQDLAKNGNIQAEQSLAENQKIIEEANRKKEAELKKQARIKLAQSVFSTYSSKVEQDVADPIAETIRDVTVLQAFINSLPTFFEGTEDTGSNGKGIDNKGGFQAILHPNERVIPKDLNDKIGNMTNEDLTRLAIDYQNKGIIASKSGVSGLDLSILVSEFKDLKQVIQDKPEFSAEVGKITQTSFEILERTKRKNTTIYNRFNVKA